MSETARRETSDKPLQNEELSARRLTFDTELIDRSTRVTVDGDADSAVVQSPPLRARSRWHQIARPTAIYLGSRLVTLLAMSVTAIVTHHSLGSEINRWDSRWFLRAAVNGWPTRLPMVHGHVGGSTIAFFPGFPLAIRGLSHLSGMSPFAAGTIISSASGLTAMIGVWILVRQFAGESGADRATLAVALFHGSFVLSLIYSEGMAITFVAFGLWALLRRRWVLAGVLGLLATATAPITLPFVVSCGWAAGVAIWKERDWRALAAPLLAPLGFVGYFVWTWRHTGNISAWRLTERGGWHSYLSIAYPFHILASFVSHPLTSTSTTDLLFVCILRTVALAIVAIRGHLPPPLLLYGLSVGALAMLTAPVGPRPRFLFDAFPLIVAVGMRWHGWKYRALIIVSAILLAALSAYAVDSFAIFP